MTIPYESVPIITIQLTHLQHTLRQHLTTFSREWEEAAQHAVDRAVEQFDFDAVLREELRKLIDTETRRAIDSAFKSVVTDMMYNPEMRGILRKRLLRMLGEDDPAPAPSPERGPDRNQGLGGGG